MTHEDNEGKTALHYVVDNKAENFDVAELLINANLEGVNKETTSEYQTPLWIAIQNGHKNIVRRLI